MAIDPTIPESSESEKQLRTELIRHYRKYKIASKKFLGNILGINKIEFLNEVFESLLIVEAAVQKIRSKYVRWTYEIARRASAEIRANPAKSNELLPVFYKLQDLLVRVDKEQATERKKVATTWRLVRGSLEQVQAYGNKAANDNQRILRQRGINPGGKKAA